MNATRIGVLMTDNDVPRRRHDTWDDDPEREFAWSVACLLGHSWVEWWLTHANLDGCPPDPVFPTELASDLQNWLGTEVLAALYRDGRYTVSHDGAALMKRLETFCDEQIALMRKRVAMQERKMEERGITWPFDPATHQAIRDEVDAETGYQPPTRCNPKGALAAIYLALCGPQDGEENR